MHVKKTTEKKQEPTSKAVNPGGVSQIGYGVGSKREAEPMYQGRGFEAPRMGSMVHKSGTQGKH